ncbi:MAG TPA: DUF2934 domain-containing protein [Gemmatimonadaceae bacterium]|nr:DUF2934 domain-containing protein [Gemmatimonadaceae bacterium]
MDASGGDGRDETRGGYEATGGEGMPGPDTDLDEDEVRRRAYELYQARGGEPGREFDDWYAAEQELRQRRAAASRSDGSAGAQREGGLREGGLREGAWGEGTARDAAPREPGGEARGGMGEGAGGERAATPRKRSTPSRRGGRARGTE